MCGEEEERAKSANAGSPHACFKPIARTPQGKRISVISMLEWPSKLWSLTFP
ncbi:hypothetical protein DNTS_001341 [Danionella cerebrum]|uniref:Uncharacterized protein n=1 Tax=Danionella cerebrum TaxID=2873325 RepID=A0A553Q3U5_9TELE|nr:hypothetical protein DNTS_001341 [Danionella translucida]